MGDLPMKRIHLVAICGVGMAPLAVILKQAGHRVTGSDNAAFPPMNEVLSAAGIEIWEGFDARHLHPAPDLVIVGNAVTRANVEAVEAERLSLPRMSFPQAVAEFFLEGKRSLVVAGTHGKTTTTGMLARVLQEAGKEPGFLVGGLVRDLGSFAAAGRGEHFVIEGDEYDSAFFDKRPKFLHYQPSGVILTSVEFDHADIYRDLNHVKEAFRQLVRLVPAEGPVVACTDHADVRDVIAPVPPLRRIAYGLTDDSGWRVSEMQSTPTGTRFALSYRGHEETRLTLRMVGAMNALNATAVYALCRELAIDPREIAAALSAYRGPARRQELVGEHAGVAVIDDFAHHPTAVSATLAAIRARFPGRRLRAVFEPRSNTSRRAVFQDAYARALANADAVVVSEVFAKQNDPLQATEMLSTKQLVESLRSIGIDAWAAGGPDEIFARLADEMRPGDVVVCMSNGSFGNLPRRLLEALGGGGAAGVSV